MKSAQLQLCKAQLVHTFFCSSKSFIKQWVRFDFAQLHSCFSIETGSKKYLKNIVIDSKKTLSVKKITTRIVSVMVSTVQLCKTGLKSFNNKTNQRLKTTVHQLFTTVQGELKCL